MPSLRSRQVWSRTRAPREVLPESRIPLRRRSTASRPRHDIGKPDTKYVDERLQGDPHSVVSARVATALGASPRISTVILHNHRAYSHWRKLLDKHGVWIASRWTEERRQKFASEFANPTLDLRLLVLFHRADNAYRRPGGSDESQDSVTWFENRLLAERLVDHCRGSL